MFAGCSQSKPDKTLTSRTQIEVPFQTQYQNTQDEEKVVPATVTVKCAYENGSPDIVEVLNISDVTDQPDESGHIICGYDAAGKLIYKREDSSFTDDYL